MLLNPKKSFYLPLHIFNLNHHYIDIINGLLNSFKIVTWKEKHIKTDLFKDEGIKSDILETY